MSQAAPSPVPTESFCLVSPLMGFEFGSVESQRHLHRRQGGALAPLAPAGPATEAYRARIYEPAD